MLKIVGIIAEYDPFHAGHAWQIQQARQAGARAVVCVMSPSVVQRGGCALFPTPVRVRAALAGGADLVLSLPAPYATLSAEGFAAAGVHLLSMLGCVDTLCFGAETPDPELLHLSLIHISVWGAPLCWCVPKVRSPFPFPMH